jgi:hypothetical protein
MNNFTIENESYNITIHTSEKEAEAVRSSNHSPAINQTTCLINRPSRSGALYTPVSAS